MMAEEMRPGEDDPDPMDIVLEESDELAMK